MSHSSHRRVPVASSDCPLRLEEPRILMIDDDPNILQGLERRFRRYQVSLLQAYYGAHGIWLATTERPDLVITDLKMPQGHGQDVVECLRNNSNTSHIPIIVVTGVEDQAVRKRLSRLGIEAYLTKPFEFKELSDAVGRVICLKQRASDEQTLSVGNTA